MKISRTSAAAATLAVALGAPSLAAAAHLSYFRATLNELNNSGVSGTVDFTVDETARSLTVIADISGLVPDAVHINHIHGRFDDAGNPINSVTPTPDADTDGDGFVEVIEGLPAYGDILLSLEDQSDGIHNGPLSDAFGNLAYTLVFDLDDDSLFFSPVSGADYTSADIFPLDLREFVIHGSIVPPGVEEGLPDGGYSVTLPVAAAEIEVIPLPAGAVLLLTGLAAFGVARRRRA